MVTVGISLYVAWAFRKVTRPVSSWKYGVVSVVTLFHDVIVPIGLFAYLGHYLGVQIDLTFIVAVLTILGYSINDTIVVFDRTRENLLRYNIKEFEETVNRSLNQTIIRSINTSLTVVIVLVSLYFFGGETLRYFALALLVGVVVGTYSSIFIASPLLVEWHNRSVNKIKKRKKNSSELCQMLALGKHSRKACLVTSAGFIFDSLFKICYAYLN